MPLDTDHNDTSGHDIGANAAVAAADPTMPAAATATASSSLLPAESVVTPHPGHNNHRTVSALTLDEDHDFAGAAPETTTTLRHVAAQACKHVTIGTAIMPEPLWGEPHTYAALVANEFNAVVIEHHLKWAPLCVAEPGPLPDEVPSDRLGRYDFETTDRMVDWALAHDLTVKGHVLVWHVTSPTALLQPLDATAMRKALQEHIYTTVGHYRGRIHEWDVVNEALAPDGSLAENIFWQTLGPSYIADAFRWAHEANPTAKLFYNDNKVEGVGTKKADALYNLVADLQAQGVPIHGVGLQGHWKAGGVGKQAVPTPRAVKQQIHRLGKLGLTVHLSEVDVRVGTLEPEKRHMAQSQIYHDILAAALSEPACTAIYTWGFTDKHSWIHDFYTDAEDEDEAPLLWDAHYRRKPAYYAVRKALTSLTPGGCVGGDGVLLETDVDASGHVWGHAWRPDTGPQGYVEEEEDDDAGGDDRPDWLQQETTATSTTSSLHHQGSDTSPSSRARLETAATMKASNVATETTNTKPDWLQDTSPQKGHALGSHKPPPDALFNLREDEAETDIVQQNHRTLSSMEVYHHDGNLGGTAGEAESADDYDDDDDDEDFQSRDAISTDDDDEGFEAASTDDIDQSGDDMTAPLENLRSDIPELS